MEEASAYESTVEIKIWSDIMCPFCYIGKRHLESALQQAGLNDKFRIEWKSFLLDPTLAVSGTTNIYQFLANKKGISHAQSVAMHEQVTAMAAAAGLHYNFDRLVVANSFQAHRLLQLAKTVGLGNEAEEILFKAYFEQGVDIGQISELIRLAQLIGIDRTLTAEAFLKTNDPSMQDKKDALSQKVLADIAQANTKSIHAVPYFLVDGQYGISGAQPVEVFRKALEEILAKKKAAPTGVNKESRSHYRGQDEGRQDPQCSIDGDC